MSSPIRPVYTLAGLLVSLSLCMVLAARWLGASGMFDRGVIAFVSECAYVAEGLYQVDVAHQIRHPLTKQHERIYSLSYSPNGRWLVFEALERGVPAFSRHRVYAIDLETNRQHPLAPEYITLNGTPIFWQPDGVHLELRMMGDIGTTLAIADLVVNVATGDVIETSPIPLTTVERNGTLILMPPPGIDTTYVEANRVDADTSADGNMVRSRLINRMFDLYVRYEGTSEEIRVTHDNCDERYPRWRPI
jgi:hypothetical protein